MVASRCTGGFLFPVTICLTGFLAACGLDSQGNILSASSGGGGFGPGDDMGHVDLKALLSGADGVWAKLEYEEEDGRREFEVKVYGGQPEAVLDVAINGVVVGSVTLDQFGDGRIEYTRQPDESHEQPFPPDFPVPSAGDVVSVGEMSGTLSLRHCVGAGVAGNASH